MSSVHQAANAAVRSLLIDYGTILDGRVGNVLYTDSKKHRNELLTKFNYSCCYCETKLTTATMEKDHLIPMNKEYVGLHAWGNLVPACSLCNSNKRGKDWVIFLLDKCGGKNNSVFSRRHNRIINHVNHYCYNKLTIKNVREISQLANGLHREVVKSVNQIQAKYCRVGFKSVLFP